MLVARPAAAILFDKRIPVIMGTSLAFGIVAVVVGLELSYHLDLAGSAAMSGTAVLLFFLVLTARRAVESVRDRRMAPIGSVL